MLGSAHRLTARHRPHNSLYVISSCGIRVDRYDKRMCSNTEITSFYSPGLDPVVFEVDGLKFGCALCIEVTLPALFAEHERLAPDVVLFSAYPGESIFAVNARAPAASHAADELRKSAVEPIADRRPIADRPITTIVGDASDLPDLVKRDFTAEAPGRKLVGDITYIPAWEGWLYLATVLDCYSKKVIGYAMADHLRTSLVTDALEMATRNISIHCDVTIFHSDRGCQYTSQQFADFCSDIGLRRSVGRTGVCSVGNQMIAVSENAEQLSGDATSGHITRSST